MSNKLANYTHWTGVWSGKGKTESGAGTVVRVEFEAVHDGAALRLHLEVCDPSITKLQHGLRAILAPTSAGGLRAPAYSTVHEGLLLDLTPDDEGVMALTGVAGPDKRVFYTFVEDAPDEMSLTLFWRERRQKVSDPGLPRMFARLHRLKQEA